MYALPDLNSDQKQLKKTPFDGSVPFINPSFSQAYHAIKSAQFLKIPTHHKLLKSRLSQQYRFRFHAGGDWLHQEKR